MVDRGQKLCQEKWVIPRALKIVCICLCVPWCETKFGEKVRVSDAPPRRGFESLAPKGGAAGVRE